MRDIKLSVAKPDDTAFSQVVPPGGQAQGLPPGFLFFQWRLDVSPEPVLSSKFFFLTGNPALHPYSLLSRSPELLSTELDGELVLMSIDLGNYYGVASTSRRIWEHLEAPITLEGLLARLAAEFDAPPDQLREDVQEFLQRLQTEGLIHIT